MAFFSHVRDCDQLNVLFLNKFSRRSPATAYKIVDFRLNVLIMFYPVSALTPSLRPEGESPAPARLEQKTEANRRI